jgi:hypothetical protein
MSSQFNAIDYSHQLQSVGIPPPHAEMHARLLSEALSNCVATKGDLLSLKNELTGRLDIFEARVKLELAGMRVEIADMRIEMRSELATMRSELITMRSEFAIMRTEIKYNRWILGFVVGLQVTLIAKSFFP